MHLQVRNSSGGIVQLSYGEDNLDPVAMEDAGGKPINLPRSLSVVHASLPQLPRIPENASDEGADMCPCKQSPRMHRCRDTTEDQGVWLDFVYPARRTSIADAA